MELELLLLKTLFSSIHIRFVGQLPPLILLTDLPWHLLWYCFNTHPAHRLLGGSSPLIRSSTLHVFPAHDPGRPCLATENKQKEKYRKEPSTPQTHN
jgi:hypothetical protein